MSDARLQEAMRLHRAGRLAEPAQGYHSILKNEPQHGEALYALAVRFLASQLTALGLEELIVPSEAAYESAALRLAREP